MSYTDSPGRRATGGWRAHTVAGGRYASAARPCLWTTSVSPSPVRANAGSTSTGASDVLVNLSSTTTGSRVSNAGSARFTRTASRSPGSGRAAASSAAWATPNPAPPIWTNRAGACRMKDSSWSLNRYRKVRKNDARPPATRSG